LGQVRLSTCPAGGDRAQSFGARIMHKTQRGFVQNEPFIVFGILCVVCVILAGTLPVAWHWRILIGLSAAVSLAAGFIAYAVLSERGRKRRAAATRQQDRGTPPGVEGRQE
jgi:hypothetical protein